ncbi:MAG: DUF882 domain-containing protein [Bdellovibrionaceae bacterium]|nr:DUF882 domain-containing protein [Pseudobdellovibrionaceae bacterium]
MNKIILVLLIGTSLACNNFQPSDQFILGSANQGLSAAPDEPGKLPGEDVGVEDPQLPDDEDVGGKDPDQNNPAELKVACYLYAQGSESCFDLVDYEEITTLDDYEYKDPYTDSSFPNGFNKGQYVKPLKFIDISNYDALIQVADNFILEELIPIRQGDYGVFSKLALRKIQNLRNELGGALFIHSAYRSPAYNKGLSGAKWSRHKYGDAIDFHADIADLDKLKELCISQGVSFYQVYKSHIHCDWRELTLDSDFYGEQVPLPLPLPIASATIDKMHKSSFVSIVDNGKEYEVSVNTDYIEDDPKDLVYSWNVQFENKKAKSYSNSKIFLKKKSKPTQIYVNIGGSLDLFMNISNK